MATLDVRKMLAEAKGGKKAPERPSTAVDKEDDLTYDLGHMYAFDPSPIDQAAMLDDAAAYLTRSSRENAQLLVNKLYGLLEGQGSKAMIKLPPPETALPREKPLPEEKATTRWEKFAKDKGIVKKKRSKMVWDESTQQWAPRFGYGRANNFKDAPENWVVEAKPGDDGSTDPFEARQTQRKQKLDKQKRQEDRNRLEAAHAASAGSGGGGGGGRGSGGSAISTRDEKKAYLKRAISAAQTSTASVGRFDKAIAGEPSKTAGKRKQYDAGIGGVASDRDAQRTSKVVDKMFPDSGRHHAAVINKNLAAKHAKLESESAAARGEGGKGGKKGGKGGGKKGGGAKGKKGRK